MKILKIKHKLKYYFNQASLWLADRLGFYLLVQKSFHGHSVNMDEGICLRVLHYCVYTT